MRKHDYTLKAKRLKNIWFDVKVIRYSICYFSSEQFCEIDKLSSNVWQFRQKHHKIFICEAKSEYFIALVEKFIHMFS